MFPNIFVPSLRWAFRKSHGVDLCDVTKAGPPATTAKCSLCETVSNVETVINFKAHV